MCCPLLLTPSSNHNPNYLYFVYNDMFFESHVKKKENPCLSRGNCTVPGRDIELSFRSEVACVCVCGGGGCVSTTLVNKISGELLCYAYDDVT